MPIELIFRNHPDLTGGIHQFRLYENLLIPTDLMFLFIQCRGKDYFKDYAQATVEERARWDRKFGGPNTLMYWMTQLVNEIEKKLRCSLSWTFERHYFSRWNDLDDDSENVFEIGPIHWLITARDERGNVVHPGWAIAFNEEWGDLLIARAKPGSAEGFDLRKIDWTACRSKLLPKLLSTMRKYVKRETYSYH